MLYIFKLFSNLSFRKVNEKSRDSMTTNGNENPRHVNKRRPQNNDRSSKNVIIGIKKR
jgi:hypothetical protein